MDGIQAAQHDIIVITDGDGTYPIEQIGDLVRKIEEGFDMAVGARQGTQQYDSLLRAPARLLFEFLVEFTTGAHIPDINSGMRSFRKSQVLPYFPDLCQGFLSSTGRMGTTLGDQWVPPEWLRRGLFDHSRDQASSPAGLATTSGLRG